jgi:hypothetical protein
LADSGDYWGTTLSTHITEDLEMCSRTLDPALFYRRDDGCLKGVTATCVDDLLQAGDSNFQKLSERTMKKFICRVREWDNVQFSGIEVESVSNGFRVHQKRYLERIAMMNKKGSFSEFRLLTARVAWATLSRPDISCDVAHSAQVNEDLFKTGI